MKFLPALKQQLAECLLCVASSYSNIQEEVGICFKMIFDLTLAMIADEADGTVVMPLLQISYLE